MNFVGTEKRVRISHVKQAIGVLVIEVRLYILIAKIPLVLFPGDRKPPKSFEMTFISNAVLLLDAAIFNDDT